MCAHCLLSTINHAGACRNSCPCSAPLLTGPTRCTHTLPPQPTATPPTTAGAGPTPRAPSTPPAPCAPATPAGAAPAAAQLRLQLQVSPGQASPTLRTKFDIAPFSFSAANKHRERTHAASISRHCCVLGQQQPGPGHCAGRPGPRRPANSGRFSQLRDRPDHVSGSVLGRRDCSASRPGHGGVYLSCRDW